MIDSSIVVSFRVTLSSMVYFLIIFFCLSIFIYGVLAKHHCYSFCREPYRVKLKIGLFSFFSAYQANIYVILAISSVYSPALQTFSTENSSLFYGSSFIP